MHERKLFDNMHASEDKEKQVDSTYALDSLLFKFLAKPGLFIISFDPGICTHTPKLAYGALTKCVAGDFILSHHVFDNSSERIYKEQQVNIEQFLMHSIMPRTPNLDSLVLASLIGTSLPALLGFIITSFDPGICNAIFSLSYGDFSKCVFGDSRLSYPSPIMLPTVAKYTANKCDATNALSRFSNLLPLFDWSYATTLVNVPHSSTEVSSKLVSSISHHMFEEIHELICVTNYGNSLHSSIANTNTPSVLELHDSLPVIFDPGIINFEHFCLIIFHLSHAYATCMCAIGKRLFTQNFVPLSFNASVAHSLKIDYSATCVPTYCQHWSLYLRKEQLLTWQQILSQAPASTHSKFTHEESSTTTCSNNLFFPINMYFGPSDLSRLMAHQFSSDHDWGPSSLPMVKSSTYHLRLIHVLHFVKATWPTHRTYTFMDCASNVLLIDGLTLLTWTLLLAWPHLGCFIFGQPFGFICSKFKFVLAGPTTLSLFLARLEDKTYFQRGSIGRRSKDNVSTPNVGEDEKEVETENGKSMADLKVSHGLFPNSKASSTKLYFLIMDCFSDGSTYEWVLQQSLLAWHWDSTCMAFLWQCHVLVIIILGIPLLCKGSIKESLAIGRGYGSCFFEFQLKIHELELEKSCLVRFRPEFNSRTLYSFLGFCSHSTTLLEWILIIAWIVYFSSLRTRMFSRGW